MKANPEKCRFICSTSKKVSLIVENKEINNITHEKLLGIKISGKLSFNFDIDDRVCKKQVLTSLTLVSQSECALIAQKTPFKTPRTI